jgi:GAF domain-containing protein
MRREDPAILDTLSETTPTDATCDRRLAALLGLAARLARSRFALLALPGQPVQWLHDARQDRVLAVPPDGILPGPSLLGGRRAVAVADAATDPRCASWPLADAPFAARGCLALRIAAPGGGFGAFAVLDTAPRSFDAAAFAALQALAGAAEDRLALRQAGAAALRDPATGIAGRAALEAAVAREIARQRRHGQPFVLLALMLAGTPDAATRRDAAQALAGAIRQEDLAGLLDEAAFGALLVGGDGREVAVAARRALAAMEARLGAAGWPPGIAAGAICFRAPPEGAGDALALVAALMRAAAEAGGGPPAFRDYRGPAAPMTASPVPAESPI